MNPIYSHDICCVRGSTLPITIQITQSDGTPYHLREGEILRFGVKTSPADEALRLEKILTDEDRTDDTYTLTLLAQDTRNWPFGTYFYDAGVQSGEDYYPIIPCSRFIVTHNITAPEANHG